MAAEQSRSIFDGMQVTPLGARSSIEDVRAVTEMNKGNIDKLGVESLAFVYGVARIDNNLDVIASVENYVSEQTDLYGVALRSGMGMVLAESFSDAFLVWSTQGKCFEPPAELQNKTTEWIVEGLTSEELTVEQKALIKPIVINLLGRIGDEVGESILDEVHAKTIMEKGGITDGEIVAYQQQLIEQVQNKTVNESLREVFGKVEE
ncbi:MAG TPA: hypothetical protein VN174_00430 [Candidatus Methanoperedens sp.]|nr:hypothetical protein [Candidatus Methanoperedens sp.]